MFGHKIIKLGNNQPQIMKTDAYNTLQLKPYNNHLVLDNCVIIAYHFAVQWIIKDKNNHVCIIILMDV